MVDGNERNRALIEFSLWLVNIFFLSKLDLTRTYLNRRSLMWQDTLVSLCYGRPLGIIVLADTSSIESSDSISATAFPFAESCHHLFVMANKIGQILDHHKASKERLTLESIRGFKDNIDQIENQSSLHMQDVSKCQHRDDLVEHYLFRVFSDSIVLCLCRPAFFSYDDDYSKALTELYLNRCRSVLRTYLKLLTLECPVRRSWVFVHVTLSCALALGLAASTYGTDRAQDQAFLKRFITAISQETICANVPAYDRAIQKLDKLLSTDGEPRRCDLRTQGDIDTPAQ